MLNKVMLIGRLGQNPELRYLPSNSTPVVNFSLATSENFRDKDGNRQEKTEWHRIVVFGKSAEHCNNYLQKGSLVYVEGNLQTRKWQDKQGVDHYTTEINARTVQFLDRKGDAGQNMNGYTPYEQEQDYSQKNTNQAPKSNNTKDADDYGSPFPSEASSLDDMPF